MRCETFGVRQSGVVDGGQVVVELSRTSDRQIGARHVRHHVRLFVSDSVVCRVPGGGVPVAVTTGRVPVTIAASSVGGHHTAAAIAHAFGSVP